MNKVERILNERVISKLTTREDLKSVITNTAWLFLDRLLRLAGGFFISLKITNYLGADSYGLMTAAMGWAVLFTPLTNLGIDGMLVRDLVNHPENKNRLLGSAWMVKLLGSLLALVIGTASAWVYAPGSSTSIIIVAIQLLTYLVLSFDVIDLYYQSKTKNKYTVYSKNLAFLVMTVIKLVMLYYNAGLVAFVIAQSAEFAVALLFTLVFYYRQGNSVRNWQVSFSTMRSMVLHSYTMALSGLVILIYMRIDQVMIKLFTTNKEVGVFSAAVRLSEVWYFIPIAIVNSTMPLVIKASKESRAVYLNRFQKLFDVMLWMGIIVAIITTFTAHWVIKVYNAEFAAAADILVVHIWAGIFVSLGVASTQYFVIDNITKYNFWRTLAGALANVGFNYILIPKYGGLGAAIATLLAHSITVFFSCGLIKESRPLFWMFMNSFNLPRVIKGLKAGF